MMISERVIDLLKEHEGWSAVPYKDTRGIWTIAYGQRMDQMVVDKATGTKWLIGVAQDKLERLQEVRGFQDLDPLRQDVLLAMAYQMGVGGVLKFRRMWAALRERDYDTAADEMMDSRWGREFSKRAGSMAERMRTGEW